ncbi:ABC transporter permease [Streptomyces spiramenti]|uniref:ABC transporter permease n=1 Tax=Streptomyces spiramenti TaxID=2720606 RepID=A0ABX1ALG6_9ACTN|nr:ABC transporter permease [Streptomyces spiramenti]NJP67957.1 ABC transporter permease [Streptomyces spiramenti]
MSESSPGGGAATKTSDPAFGAVPKASSERARSLWSDAWRDLRRDPVFIIASLIVLAVISMVLFPSLWTSGDPRDCDLARARQKPSWDAPFGFSNLGCDYYAQAIYGAGPSIQVAVFATIGIAIIGTLFGVLSGFYGGLVDTVISRLVDVVAGLPFLLGAVVLLALMQSRSVWAIVFVLIALAWITLTRVIRGTVMTTKNMDYVAAARSLGASDRRIIFRHILPNAMAPGIVVLTIALGLFVSLEATLTFLGVGLRAPTVSWGVMIVQGQSHVLSGYPHLLLVPCMFLVTTVLGFILMGDALRDALDPKLR